MDSDKLRELVALANALKAAQEVEEAAEKALKAASARVRQLQEEEIPYFMTELGVTSFKLESGETVSWKNDVRIELPAEQKEAAWGWLEAHGFGGLIKTTVTASFGKGELEQAKELLTKLEAMGYHAAALARNVHYQTLCAFLREQLESNAEIPLETFGAVAIKRASLKAPSKARAKREDAIPAGARVL